MKHRGRLKKLVAVVCIAFAVCVSLGIYRHESVVGEIKFKNHGYKGKSFCRVGIDLVMDFCRKTAEELEKELQKFMRFLLIQRIKYEHYKLNNSLSVTKKW